MTETNNNNTTQHAGLADRCYVYAKTKWMRSFKAFDLSGFFVANLIFASMVVDDNDTRTRLQRLADEHRGQQLQFQLRKPSGNSVMYETKLIA